MLKIVIVDDEPLVRLGIKSSIPWEENGLTFAGEAEDGKQAIELIDRIKPDIVFTDIKMPNLDGIALIQHIKSTFPYMKIIVLSCINEMEVVKKALLLGADDYILKLSLKPSALVMLLKQLTEKIKAEQIQRKQQENFNHIISSNLSAVKTSLINRYLRGNITEAETVKSLEAIGVNHLAASFYPVIGSLDAFSSLEGSKKIEAEIDKILDELSSKFELSVIHLWDSEYLFAVDASIYHHNYVKQSVLPRINRILLDSCHVSISFSLLDKAITLDMLQPSISKMQHLLQWRFYFGEHSIVTEREATQFTNQNIVWDLTSETLIQQFLESANFEGLKAKIHQDFQNFRKAPQYHPAKFKLAVMEFIQKLLKCAGIYYDLYTGCDSKDLSQSETIMRIETISSLEQNVISIINNISWICENHSCNIKRKEIAKIKKYVYEHPKENITTSFAANYVNISRSYFSSLFKKETGENFVDFVNRTKMEYAKKLLIQSNYRVYEVSCMIGIDNETYFSKLFKKYIGVSPSKFSKNLTS